MALDVVLQIRLVFTRTIKTVLATVSSCSLFFLLPGQYGLVKEELDFLGACFVCMCGFLLCWFCFVLFLGFFNFFLILFLALLTAGFEWNRRHSHTTVSAD